jgi:hypothetical protein
LPTSCVPSEFDAKDHVSAILQERSVGNSAMEDKGAKKSLREQAFLDA